ncbi:MAG: hypothetical protein M1305_00705 [Candidatus Marsarchaeota archaeon]|nr:hypothetical protein [Candidatus Marsarchaeota archaeon]
MTDSEQSSTHLDLRPEILASPAYTDRCKILFDFFLFSRAFPNDPRAIIDLQTDTADIIMSFQSKKAEYRKENNALGVAVTRRLLLVAKGIVDSIVWRALGYNRSLVHILAEHPRTGDLDSTVYEDLKTAKDLVEQKNAIVLVNDLTSGLRHGDLTVITKDGFDIVETKYGKSSAQSPRARRQTDRLNQLLMFIRTGVRVNQGKQDWIVRVDVPLRTYHSVVADSIEEAFKSGYQQRLLSDCLAIETVSFEHASIHTPKLRPFQDVEHTVTLDSMRTSDQPAARIAPYGIFPFDPKICFGLLTGTVLLRTTLNLDHLQGLYREHGLALELPVVSEREMKAYFAASIAERKKMLQLGQFAVTNGDVKVWVSPEFLSRTGLELLDEKTIVRGDEQLLRLVKDLGVPFSKTHSLFVDYKDEDRIWS